MRKWYASNWMIVIVRLFLYPVHGEVINLTENVFSYGVLTSCSSSESSQASHIEDKATDVHDLERCSNEYYHLSECWHVDRGMVRCNCEFLEHGPLVIPHKCRWLKMDDGGQGNATETDASTIAATTSSLTTTTVAPVTSATIAPTTTSTTTASTTTASTASTTSTPTGMTTGHDPSNHHHGASGHSTCPQIPAPINGYLHCDNSRSCSLFCNKGHVPSVLSNTVKSIPTKRFCLASTNTWTDAPFTHCKTFDEFCDFEDGIAQLHDDPNAIIMVNYKQSRSSSFVGGFTVQARCKTDTYQFEHLGHNCKQAQCKCKSRSGAYSCVKTVDSLNFGKCQSTGRAVIL